MTYELSHALEVACHHLDMLTPLRSRMDDFIRRYVRSLNISDRLDCEISILHKNELARRSSYPVVGDA